MSTFHTILLHCSALVIINVIITINNCNVLFSLFFSFISRLSIMCDVRGYEKKGRKEEKKTPALAHASYRHPPHTKYLMMNILSIFASSSKTQWCGNRDYIIAGNTYFAHFSRLPTYGGEQTRTPTGKLWKFCLFAGQHT